jgi:hypothetical protein
LSQSLQLSAGVRSLEGEPIGDIPLGEGGDGLNDERRMTNDKLMFE